MSRRVYAGSALVLGLVGGTLLWWMLSGAEESVPQRQSIGGLTDTVSVGWTAQHTAVVDARHASDALAALGYVHGMKRSWTVTVWRRTALGTLATTFGKDLVPVDRHARRLGFADHARRAYDQLPEEERTRLQAYTRGLNAGLQSARVRRQDPFVYLNLTPQRWQPWHPLAIERLLAWVSADLSPVPGVDEAALSDLRSADRLLRRWLHLHGGERSVAWAARPSADTARTALFARHILGATAEPLVQEVAFRRPSARPTVTASLPGTLLFPTGTTGSRSWTYLLSSRARLTRVEMDTSRVRTRHERITSARGNEQLVEVRRHGEDLLVGSTSPDSAWVLRWPGLRARTDVPRWIAHAGLRSDPPPIDSVASAFRLFSGSGLTMDSSGAWTVRGRPPVVERGSGMVLVGRSSWARHQADGLQDQRATASLNPERLGASDSSTWAAALLPRLLPDLAPLEDAESPYDDALSYLRNWDFVYEPASIGAVVFERWMEACQTEKGRMPSAADSTVVSASRRRQAFRRAVDTLAAQYGPDVRRWRWERVAQTQRYFPVWSADSLVAADLSDLSGTQFAPLGRPGRGHASTLAGGPTLVDPPPIGPAPGQWDGWMRGGESDLTVRRLRFDPSAFFARSLLPREPPPSVSVSEAPIKQTTQLVPGELGRK